MSNPPISGYFWQAFQPGAILLSAVFRLFGGDCSVFNAVVMAAAADAVSESQRSVAKLIGAIQWSLV